MTTSRFVTERGEQKALLDTPGVRYIQPATPPTRKHVIGGSAVNIDVLA